MSQHGDRALGHVSKIYTPTFYPVSGPWPNVMSACLPSYRYYLHYMGLLSTIKVYHIQARDGRWCWYSVGVGGTARWVLAITECRCYNQCGSSGDYIIRRAGAIFSFSFFLLGGGAI